MFNSFVLFFFLIFPYLLAQKQVKCFKYSVHDSNITSVSLYDKGRTTTGAGNKLIRGYRAAVSPKHLKTGTPREKCLYLLALNVEILPQLLGSQFKKPNSGTSCPQKPHHRNKEGVWLAEEIFYSCKQADEKSSNMPKLDSKSLFAHYTKTSPPDLSSSPNVKKSSPCLWKWSFEFYAVSVDQASCSSSSSRASYWPPNTSIYLQPQHCT